MALIGGSIKSVESFSYHHNWISILNLSQASLKNEEAYKLIPNHIMAYVSSLEPHVLTYYRKSARKSAKSFRIPSQPSHQMNVIAISLMT